MFWFLHQQKRSNWSNGLWQPRHLGMFVDGENNMHAKFFPQRVGAKMNIRVLPEHYKNPILTNFFAPQPKLFARCLSNLVYIGAEGFFKKFFGLFGRKWFQKGMPKLDFSVGEGAKSAMIAFDTHWKIFNLHFMIAIKIISWRLYEIFSGDPERRKLSWTRNSPPGVSSGWPRLLE